MRMPNESCEKIFEKCLACGKTKTFISDGSTEIITDENMIIIINLSLNDIRGPLRCLHFSMAKCLHLVVIFFKINDTYLSYIYKSQIKEISSSTFKRFISVRIKQLSVWFTACLNGVVVGNLAGWPQAAIPQLLSGERPFTESQVSWIAGIFFLGMLAGGFTSLGVAGRFGKRRLFLLACLPLVVGWSIIAVAATFWVRIFIEAVIKLDQLSKFLKFP